MSSVPPDPHDRTLAQQLSRAFLVCGFLVGIAFFVTALAYAACRVWLTPDFDRSRTAVRGESAAFAAMLDQENGLRGYLMTRDVRFLEAYERGQAGLLEAHKILAANVDLVSNLAATMLATRLAEERWNERWAKAAADLRPGAVAPSMFEGKVLFDAYRTDQSALADALDQRSELLSRREQRVIATRVALDMLVFIAVLLFTVHQHRALRESIVAPVAALLRHIGNVRDGQLEATVDPEGPRELRQLGEGLNQMVRALAAARGVAASRDDALRDHSARLRRILDASREFSESLNLAYVVGAVRASTAAVGGYERVIVWLMDDEQKRLIESQEDNDDAPPPSDRTPEADRGLAARAAKSGRITFEDAVGHVRFSDSNVGPVRAIAIPLIVGARVVGALEARHTEAVVATREVIEVLEMLAIHAATAIESARLHEVIEERSQVDALTRLLNRRRLDEDLDAECKRCVRYGRPLAFVMLDVDHFKAFNDTHGHPQADKVLQELATIIGGCVRTTDTAYRYGGEEFSIILRETTGADATRFAERVRQRIEQRFATGGVTGVTASFGVAEFSAENPTPRALVEAADAAMYESKHAGRNRVVLSSRPPVGPSLLPPEPAPQFS